MDRLTHSNLEHIAIEVRKFEDFLIPVFYHAPGRRLPATERETTPYQ